VHLEAPGDDRPLRTRSRRHVALHQSLPPSCRSLCGLRPDAVGVVAEGDMELRPVPERTVDEIRAAGIAQRPDVDFQGMQQLLGRPLVASEDGLTAEHYKLVLAGDVRRCGDDMLKLIRTQARSPLARSAGAQAR